LLDLRRRLTADLDVLLDREEIESRLDLGLCESRAPSECYGDEAGSQPAVRDLPHLRLLN
jgi:hypothetical protein